MKIRNKKAQVGETMTWIIATIVIIVVLVISIFVTNFVFGGGKTFNIFHSTDSVATKSLSAYLLTLDNSGKKVFDQLKDEEDLSKFFNNFSGSLAVRIFEGLYEKDYPARIWLGLYTPVGYSSITRKNEYFGGPGHRGVSEEIQLKDEKYLMLTLTKSN